MHSLMQVASAVIVPDCNRYMFDDIKYICWTAAMHIGGNLLNLILYS